MLGSWAMMTVSTRAGGRFISSTMRSSMELRLMARRSSSSLARLSGRRRDESPLMIERTLSFMPSTRPRTRRATNRPADRADDDQPEQRGEQRPREHAPQRFAIFEVAADEQAEAARQKEDAGQRPAFDPQFTLALIGGFTHARLIEHARRPVRDIASDSLAGEIGDEIERGTGLARAPLDHIDNDADAATGILFGQAVDFGFDCRCCDLLVKQTAHAPGRPSR